MPEITVSMAAGRTDEQKAGMMRDITQALVKNLGVDADAVVIQINEAPLAHKMKGGKTFVERAAADITVRSSSSESEIIGGGSSTGACEACSTISASIIPPSQTSQTPPHNPDASATARDDFPQYHRQPTACGVRRAAVARHCPGTGCRNRRPRCARS